MNINYQYFLFYIKNLPKSEGLKVLDFGCGNGEIVELLRDNGINSYGVDIYFQGIPDSLKDNKLFKSGYIKAIYDKDGLPFPEKYFDVIISNQVFEHVKDLDSLIESLDKILNDNGIMYHHFPIMEVWRENHTGIPFLHWFKSGSKFRYYYSLILRSFGMGFHKDQWNTKIGWVNHKLDYLDKLCFYRKYSRIKEICKGYNIVTNEINYIKFRWGDTPLVELILKLHVFHSLYIYIFRRLAFISIELKK